MKEFNKDEGLFVCNECNKKFILKNNLVNHINKYHDGIKLFYDRWLKEEGEGICKNCGNITKFVGIKRNGYLKACSYNCANKLRSISHLSPLLIEKDIYEKRKKTCLEKYGVENISQLDSIKRKKENTCLKNIGVKYYSQERKRYEDSLKTRLLIHKFRETDLWYQGSYELDFLEKFYDIIDIKRGPSIKYIYNKKDKIYHPDFYIPSLNLIIEIKSSWTLKLDLEINEKKKYTKKNGYKYILIINKDYKKFINNIRNATISE